MPLPDDCDIPDPLDLLAWIAGRTERLRLGTGILVLPEHHPLQLAKRVATIDRLSGGRVFLGVGVGWMREELEALGIDPDDARRAHRRGHRGAAGDLAGATRWRRSTGEHFALRPRAQPPQAGRRPRVPILVGGHSAGGRPTGRPAGRRVLPARAWPASSLDERVGQVADGGPGRRPRSRRTSR